MEHPRPRIGLVGCVKGKLTHAAPAQDLYVSDLFRGRRSYVERTCDRWFVLSAKHHLLGPEETVAPYDLALTSSTDHDRRVWSTRVLEMLRTELGDLAGYEFELHAGDEYRSFGLRDGLDRAGALTVYPVAGMPFASQLAFYAAAHPVPAAIVEGTLTSNPGRAAEVARRLWRAWTGEGIFGTRVMPESHLPIGMERGSRAHSLFVTLTVSLDYMRDADALWRSARAAYDDEHTTWLFEPADVAQSATERLRDGLVSTGLAKRSDQDTRIWQTVVASLGTRFDGDPRQIAVRADYLGLAMIEELRRVPGTFPWLQGPKIAPLWVRMMADEVGLRLRDLDEIPIPVDIHIARATFASGSLEGQFRGTVSEAAPTIQNLWRDALRDTELYPLQIDQALWLQSRDGCSHRNGDRCPREDACAIADLCASGEIRTDKETLIVDTSTGQPRSGDTPPPRGFPAVWQRIRDQAGQGDFTTRQGIKIAYDMEGDVVVVREKINARIPRDHFEKAFQHVPLRTLADVSNELWGRSYIFAILSDARISNGE